MAQQGNSRQGIQVISRAVKVLRSLEGKPDGMSLSAIANEVDLPRSTVQRIVGALAAEGFLISASPTSRVRLGPSLVSLGSAAKIDIDRVILPYMKKLSQEIEETVDLSVQDGASMIFIDQVIADSQKLRAVSAVGDAFPIHSCANGKAILASKSDAEISSILSDKPFTKLTQYTLSELSSLKKEIESIRKKSVAFDREEHCEGVCAIGIAIEDPYGRNIALSIPVPSVRFNRNKKAISDKLIEYKFIIEKALGASLQ
ncbi:IclR family transcriptional regulator [Alteromonas sp. BL110]|uniref:IclR family transcriptional regulator n=1 Tax=Alteromonas sp. BL110 TaxID=1714845 RepID=UPI000E4BFB4E|nr:IclR family transcriptional regulator [Alteromonas sp. BL110]AXT39265.1 IclR family transcriptional regulator [Alteromonas sp. BL110]RKM82251.1 IclR family transcriptional regulator [Alteromonas sp. BL110]